MNVRDEPMGTPPQLSPSTLPQAEELEVSMVEAEDVTGVIFTPEYVEEKVTLVVATDTLIDSGCRGEAGQWTC